MLIKTVNWMSVLLGAGVLWGSAAVVGDERPPNFVLIFIDDQGYQDLGCYGSPTIKSPNLDRMAKEGTRFTDFYSLAPICSASRAALLTGCYPERVGITGVLFPRHRIGLNPSEHTIAKVLKKKDYATACIGKWHLGHHPEFLPTSHGFDQFYGVPYSNDMDPVQGKRRDRDRQQSEPGHQDASSCSTTRAARKRRDSSNGGARSCRPIGRVPEEDPQGTEIPGIPARLTETV